MLLCWNAAGTQLAVGGLWRDLLETIVHSEHRAYCACVTQGVAESSHQQGRQKGRPELAIFQKANSTPRKGRMPGHRRFSYTTGVRTQVLVATRKADSRAVHGEPQEGHGVRRHRQRQAVLSDVRSVRRAYLYRAKAMLPLSASRKIVKELLREGSCGTSIATRESEFFVSEYYKTFTDISAAARFTLDILKNLVLHGSPLYKIAFEPVAHLALKDCGYRRLQLVERPEEPGQASSSGPSTRSRRGSAAECRAGETPARRRPRRTPRTP